MKILCLDLGTCTGWAMAEDGRKPTSGTAKFKNGRFDGGGMRFLRFERWLNEMLDFGVEAVYFEEVRAHAGTTAAHVYGGLLAFLTAVCEKRKIPHEGVPVGTIKKHATGHGKANKVSMIQAAQRRGHDPEDDNEADALAIAYWAIETRFPSSGG